MTRHPIRTILDRFAAAYTRDLEAFIGDPAEFDAAIATLIADFTNTTGAQTT